jgi:hypothetical protein
VRLSPISFHHEPNRDYVLVMNTLLAACAGVSAAMYLHLGWWSLAIAVVLGLALELALRSRYTAWLSVAIGSAFSAALAGVGGIAITASLTSARQLMWCAGALGAIVGAALMIDAHRKLRGAGRRAPS